MGIAEGTAPIFFPADLAGRAIHHRQTSHPPQAATDVLPESIAFLTASGIDPDCLAECAYAARSLNMPAETLVITRNIVSEHAFYEALARHLRLRFVSVPEQGRAHLTPITTANFGFAPWTSGADDCLIAPRGALLVSLLRMARRNVLPTQRLSITTPHAFARWSRTGAAPTLAAQASQDLTRSDPALSAATPPTRRQWIALATVLATAIVAPLMSGPVWMVLELLISVILAGAILLRLLAVAASCGRRNAVARILSDAELPIYTLIVPLYHEGAVAAQLVAALDALDYPALGSKLTKACECY